MTDHIKTSVEEGVGIILFDRPEALNAMSPEMVTKLSETAHAFESNPEVRAVLIQSTGDTFMAGGDVKGFHEAILENQDTYAARLEARVVSANLAIHRLRRMPKPVLVAVQGAAVGLGVSLVALADLAIGADDAYLMLAYRHIGLTADGGASYFLPRIVGERRALEIVLLGERIPAERALEWGLFNWIEPRATLPAKALSIARKLAEGPTLAQGGAKRLFRASFENSWEEQSMREAESISGMAATADHREGVAAFLEKRKPKFQGTKCEAAKTLPDIPRYSSAWEVFDPMYFDFRFCREAVTFEMVNPRSRCSFHEVGS